MLAEHRRIIAALETRREYSTETPGFLHARVMAGIRESESAKATPGRTWGWTMPAGAAALLVLVGSVWFSQKRVEPTAASWPEIKTAFALEATIPRNPLEVEIENLKADTLNVTRALAASFNTKEEAEK
jgi:hypothetical protein